MIESRQPRKPIRIIPGLSDQAQNYSPSNIHLICLIVCLFVCFLAAMCNMKTSDGKCCVFPFVYRGQTFNACTSSRASRLWCSLSPSYDEDRKYGWCRGGSFYMQSGRVWQLRWLDRVFQGEHLPNLSIKYVAINKDLKKLRPQLYNR